MHRAHEVGMAEVLVLEDVSFILGSNQFADPLRKESVDAGARYEEIAICKIRHFWLGLHGSAVADGGWWMRLEVALSILRCPQAIYTAIRQMETVKTH
jgi:hypothetical protein